MSLILLFLLVTVGALVSSLAGMGGGTIILAGLLLVYPPELAIPLHSFTQIATNSLRTGVHLKGVDWKVVGWYASLMLPCAWIAAKGFDLINPYWLKVFVGVFILFSIIPFRFKPKGEPTKKTFMILGAAAASLGVFVGAVGPMVMPYFNRLKLPRDGMLSTKCAGQVLLQTSKIIAFSGAAGINFIELKSHVGFLIMGSLTGVLISIPLGRKIPDELFNKGLTVLLGILAIKIFVEGVQGLL